MSSSTIAAAAPTIEAEYHAFGAIARLFRLLSGPNPPGEVLVKGPAGTGKTRGILEVANWAATEYAGARILLARKTRRSLTETAMVTFETRVLHAADGVRWQASKQRYAYPNGSVVAVGGLDKASKIMSSDWDLIVVPEATELTEAEHEALTTRLRNGVTPFQTLIEDCNPAEPTHWLTQRARGGKVAVLWSVHEDNPVLWDRVTGAWTEGGTRYIGKLDELTGVRYLRLRKGLDAAAEGMIYEAAWDRAKNVRPRALFCTPRPDGRYDLYGDCGLPRTWPRILGIDFGFTHPFVCQWWAVDPDGRLILYRELYRTHRLVEDHAKDILRCAGWELRSGRPFPLGAKSDPLPVSVLCDHDAEDRHTLSRHTGLATLAAYKDVSAGIQAVAARMRPAGDGQPRLLVLEDSLVERDTELADRHLPLSFVDEVDGYVWDTRQGRTRGEQPLKENDHAMDTSRYVVASRDLRDQDTSVLRSVW